MTRVDERAMKYWKKISSVITFMFDVHLQAFVDISRSLELPKDVFWALLIQIVWSESWILAKSSLSIHRRSRDERPLRVNEGKANLHEIQYQNFQFVDNITSTEKKFGNMRLSFFDSIPHMYLFSIISLRFS